MDSMNVPEANGRCLAPPLAGVGARGANRSARRRCSFRRKREAISQVFLAVQLN
jgi:hypothetical protein